MHVNDIDDGYHDGNGAIRDVIIANEIEIEINRFTTHTMVGVHITLLEFVAWLGI